MTATRRHARPLPEDFAELSAKLTYAQMRAHYGAGDATIKRWLEKVSAEPRRRLPAPADLADMAVTMTRRELKAHYKVGALLLRRWIAEVNASPRMAPIVTPSRPKPLRAMPDDFREVAPTLNMRMLQEHYATSWDTARRWLNEAGIETATIRAVCTRQVRPIIYKNWSRGNQPISSRTYSVQDEAADVIRHHMPVYRCDERGRAHEKGAMWRVGNVVVDGDELLVRAERYRRKAA